MTTSPEPSPEPQPGSQLAAFAGQLSFRLDPFQVQACQALERGHGVLVCAPTGAGKTVVGEFAVHLALAAGQKCFYTTPIKALSNQKHSDLVRRYGAQHIGLLTRRALETLERAPINAPARVGLTELAGLAANRSA